MFFFYSVVVDRANQWLIKHPDYCVWTCESIESKKKIYHDIADTVKSDYQTDGEYTDFNRSLRWADFDSRLADFQTCNSFFL